MTLTELKYVIAVAQERHFGRAAELCHVSQPSLSVAVKKLEKELGVNIFERRSTDITLTPIGELIVEQAQRVLEDAQKLRECAQQGKDPLSGALRLGVIYTIAPFLLPSLVAKMRESAPAMPLVLTEGFTATLLEELKNGQLDCAIMALPVNQPGLMIKPLYDEEFVATIPKNHRLASKSSINRKDLKRESMLLLCSGHCFRDQILDFCGDLFTRDQHSYEGSSLQTIVYMVAQGLGVTLLPATSTPYYRDSSEIAILPFEQPTVPKRRVVLVWRKSFPRPEAIAALAEAVGHIKLQGATMLTSLPAVTA